MEKLVSSLLDVQETSITSMIPTSVKRKFFIGVFWVFCDVLGFLLDAK
jgi:hypothetical protein